MKVIRYRRILLPYDFRPEFAHSLKVAEEIARASDASITLLYSLTPHFITAGPFPNCFFTCFDSGISRLPESEKALKKVILRSDFPSNRFEIKLLLGDFFQSIVSSNEVDPYDLIILPEFKQNFGSMFSNEIHAIDLMKRIKIPVITVNNARESFYLRNILVPIRNIDGWFEKIPFTVALAKMTNAKILVLDLPTDSGSEYLATLRKKKEECIRYLEKNYPDFEVVEALFQFEPYRNLLEVAKRCKADLISVTPGALVKSRASMNFYSQVVAKGTVPVFGVIP